MFQSDHQRPQPGFQGATNQGYYRENQRQNNYNQGQIHDENWSNSQEPFQEQIPDNYVHDQGRSGYNAQQQNVNYNRDNQLYNNESQDAGNDYQVSGQLNNYEQLQSNTPQQNLNYQRNDDGYQRPQRPNQLPQQPRNNPSRPPPIISHASHTGGAVFGVVVKQPSPMAASARFPAAKNYNDEQYNIDDPRYQQQQESMNNFRNERDEYSNQNLPQQEYIRERESLPQSHNTKMYDSREHRDQNLQQQYRGNNVPLPSNKPDNRNRFNEKNVNQDQQFDNNIQQPPPARDTFYKHRKADYDPIMNAPPLKSPTSPSYRQNDQQGQNQDNYQRNVGNPQVQQQYNNSSQQNQSYNNPYQSQIPNTQIQSRYTDNQPQQDLYYNNDSNPRDYSSPNNRQQPPQQYRNHSAGSESNQKIFANIQQRPKQNEAFLNEQVNRNISPIRSQGPPPPQSQNYQASEQIGRNISPSRQQMPPPHGKDYSDRQMNRNILPNKPQVPPQQHPNHPLDRTGRNISPTRPHGQQRNYIFGRQNERNIIPNVQNQNYPIERQYNNNYAQQGGQSQQTFDRSQQSEVETKSQNMQAVKNMFERKSNNAPPIFPKNNIRPVPPRPNISTTPPQRNINDQHRGTASYYDPQQERYQRDGKQPNNNFDNMPLPPPPDDLLNNSYRNNNQYDDQRLNNQPQPNSGYNNYKNETNVNNTNYNQRQDHPYYNDNRENDSQVRNYSNTPQFSPSQPPPNQSLTSNRYEAQYADFGYQEQSRNFPVPPPDARNNQQSYTKPINVPQPPRDDFYNPNQQNERSNKVPFEQYRDRDIQIQEQQNSQARVQRGNIPNSKSWNQPFNNRGSRTSFTDDQRQYDRSTRGSTGTYESQQNVIQQNSLSPRASYSKPPQKQNYSKSMNNLDQVQDSPHIEIESYEESTFENGTTFTTSPNLKPVVVAVTFNGGGVPNKQNPPTVHGGNVYRIQAGGINRQPPPQKTQPRVTFPEPPHQPYIPPDAQNQFTNDNSSELSNYVPSVVARSYDAFSNELSTSPQQPAKPSRVQNDNGKGYSQVQYSVQGARGEGIPTPPRTDRPQQHRNHYQESAPKPVLTKRNSDETRQRRQPVSYANDENWRVISPTNSDLTNQQNLPHQQQIIRPQVTIPQPKVVQSLYDTQEEEEDDSSEGIDVDAPTPPPKVIQKQQQFLLDPSGKPNNIYHQNRPRQINNEAPKGYHHPTNKLTSVKPPTSHEQPPISKPKRNLQKQLSPTFQAIPQREVVVSEEDSGIFDDKNGSTLSNVSSLDKVRLGKSGAMGRRKPPTRMSSSQNITEDAEDESDFQIEVTNFDLQDKTKKIEVHREQSMKEIRKKQALRKKLLEQEQQRKAKEQIDESIQTDLSNNVAQFSSAKSAIDPSTNKTSSKYIFKVPEKPIPTTDVKDIPIVAYEEPKDSKKQPKYDDLLGQFKNARDSALKSAQTKQAGALKAVTGLVRMSKKHEPEPKKKLIPRPEKNAHVLERAQEHYIHEIKRRDDVEPPREHERRPSPEKSRPRDNKEEDRRRPEDRRLDELERDQRSKERDYQRKREDRERAERDRQKAVEHRRKDNRREDYRDRRDNQHERERVDNFRRSDDMRRSPQKYREPDRERREPSRGRRNDYDDEIRRDRYDPTRSPRRGDYDPRDREPDWVQQFRRNRGPESQGSDNSRVSKRAWVNDPRRRANRELDMDEFEREPPRRQVMPTKLMAKKPQHRRPPPSDDWMKALKQKNKSAERHRYRRY